MPLRPILKQRCAATAPPPHQLAVHFPPSPSLTTHTFAVYSSAAYDRSPIVVSPNSCALPERGCPGRTYTLDDPATSSPTPKRGHPYGGRDLHPRAIAFNSARQQQLDPDRTPRACPFALLPSLIPDISSESDESDGFSSPPIESSYLPQSSHLHGLAIPHDKYAPYSSFDLDVCEPSPSALSFLPHPPSSPSYPPYPHEPASSDPSQKPRRRRERKHESSRNPDRIPGGAGDVQDSPTPTKSRKSKVAGLSKSLTARHATSSFRLEDDGCLGGF